LSHDAACCLGLQRRPAATGRRPLSQKGTLDSATIPFPLDQQRGMAAGAHGRPVGSPAMTGNAPSPGAAGWLDRRTGRAGPWSGAPVWAWPKQSGEEDKSPARFSAILERLGARRFAGPWFTGCRGEAAPCWSQFRRHRAQPCPFTTVRLVASALEPCGTEFRSWGLLGVAIRLRRQPATCGGPRSASWLCAGQGAGADLLVDVGWPAWQRTWAKLEQLRPGPGVDRLRRAGRGPCPPCWPALLAASQLIGCLPVSVGYLGGRRRHGGPERHCWRSCSPAV